MIHELIEQKKKQKSQRASTSRNTKAHHNPKAASQNFRDTKVAAFEVSSNENKGAVSSSTVFIPPWLKNSLGLNQRNNLNLDWSLCLPNFTALGPAGGSSESKSSKNLQRDKGISQNEYDSSKGNLERERCKKAPGKFELVQKNGIQDVSLNQGAVDTEDGQNVSDGVIPVYWNMKPKKSDSGSSCGNLENQCLKKDSKTAGGEPSGSAGVGKTRAEDKKRLKFFRSKNRMRKQVMANQKQPELEKNGIDFLLEIKARDAQDDCPRGRVRSASPETKHRDTKFLFLGPKSHNHNRDPKREEFRMLRDLKSQVGTVNDLEKVFERVKDSSFREFVKPPETSPKNVVERTAEEEEKFARGPTRKYTHEGNSKPDKDSLLSTDDEYDIKRFSEFLSKNKNTDEKRKCLEEVRNYFERKRRTRLTKRNILEDEKPKTVPRSDRKEEQMKEKAESRESPRGRRCNFALGEEAVEKAVDETLQKFVELYHFRVSPTGLENMKKSILQAIKADITASGGGPKLNEARISPLTAKKANFESLMKEPDVIGGTMIFADRDIPESPKKEPRFYREGKKKNVRTFVDSFGDQLSKHPREGESLDSEKLRRLRKDFDNFLHSVQGRIDLSSLKLQSLILEKEEKTPSAKGVHFVYSFEKKLLEPIMAELRSSYFDGMEVKNQKDSQMQTTPGPDKKNAKIQVQEPKISSDQCQQTEGKASCTQDTQTEGKGVIVREINDLKGQEMSAGLYRMVRAKEAGKFYLYPEEGGKGEASRLSKSYIMKGKKSKRADFLSVIAKERRFFSKEREKSRLKKIKRAVPYKNVGFKNAKKKKNAGTSEDSINCLYFRNLGKNGSESLSSKKELTDDNPKDQFDSEERVEDMKEDRLGCWWYWNGEKISPGCDLRTHVENIIKEKLTNFEGQQNELLANVLNMTKFNPEQSMMSDASGKTVEIRAMNSILCYNNPKSTMKEMGMESPFEERANHEERRKIEAKRTEGDSIGGPLMSVPLEKLVKSVATQNSQPLTSGAGLVVPPASRLKNSFKRKCTRRNIIIKSAPGGRMTTKKAEAIIKAVEEIKKLKLGLVNPKNDSLMETEIMIDGSTSTLGSNKKAVMDLESRMKRILGPDEEERLTNADLKSKIEKLINVVDREVQTTGAYEGQDSNSVDNEGVEQTEDSHKHIDLIENVLGKVNKKVRENLWNDVRDFIKTKIGRDINDEGAREVCIEIEQDLPKAEQNKVKQSIMARGHYSKNEGDVEVEIDLTLEDVAKILRQRQRKIRRRNSCRNSKSRTFLSSSSVQSDITRDDLRRYQKYLQKPATAEGSITREKEIRGYLRNKGN